jgi:hypothetical protein
MKKLFISIYALLLPVICFAAPSITNVSGTVGNGHSIIITGTDFGATGPTIIIFDDFELGANGTNVSDQVRNAQVGTWRQVTGLAPYYATYSNIQKNSGSQALRQDWSSGPSDQDGARWVSPTMGGPHQKLYFSFWLFLPTGQNIPGTCCGVGPNFKQWWLSTNDVFQNDYGFVTITDSSPFTIGLGPIDGGDDRLAGYYGVDYYDYHPSIWTRGRWMRAEVYIVAASDNTGELYAWLMDSANPRYLWQSGSGDNTVYAGYESGWNYLHFPGYGRYDTNSNTYFDDIYVAAGNGARARVELGDSELYDDCTNLAILTPTDWRDTGSPGGGSITATVRTGSFSAGDTAYLFVIDADGEVQATGHEVTIGPGITEPTRTESGGGGGGGGGGCFIGALLP